MPVNPWAGNPAAAAMLVNVRLNLSRGEGDFADKIFSALRYQFGGHEEKAAVKRGDA